MVKTDPLLKILAITMQEMREEEIFLPLGVGIFLKTEIADLLLDHLQMRIETTTMMAETEVQILTEIVILTVIDRQM